MPVVLLYGDNSVEIERELNGRRGAFDSADTVVLEGTAPLAQIAEAAATPGLFAPERLVIVRGLHERYRSTRKDKPDVGEVDALLEAVGPQTILLLVEVGMDTDHALLAGVQRVAGEVKRFTMPKRAELPRWIVAEGRRQGATIDKAAADLLADALSANPTMIQTEVAKLATYAQTETITAPIVEALVGAVPQSSIFALVDTIAAGDRQRAFELLHEQLHFSSEPSRFPMQLMSLIARQLRILLRIRAGESAGRTRSQIISDVKVPRYYADRYFQQAHRISTERLRRSFEQLAAFDHDLKTGRSDAGTGLELLIEHLCAS